MKRLYIQFIVSACCITMLSINILFTSCNDDFLNEKPVSDLSGDNVLTSVAGFENYINSLHYFAKEELSGDDLRRYFNMFTGTDIVCVGQLGESPFRNYETYLSPSTDAASRTWNWLYTSLVQISNEMIESAENSELNHIWV